MTRAIRLFVYGSLMRGLGNHETLRGARYLGEARTGPWFTLVDLGAFPAMLGHGRTEVVGELYEVPPEVLERVDHLEGHPRFYRRELVELEDGSTAEAYLLVHERRARVVESGDWKAERRTRCE